MNIGDDQDSPHEYGYADDTYSAKEIQDFCEDCELTKEEEQALENIDRMFFIWKICKHKKGCRLKRCSAKCKGFEPVDGCRGCKHNPTCSVAELCSDWENYEQEN